MKRYLALLILWVVLIGASCKVIPSKFIQVIQSRQGDPPACGVEVALFQPAADCTGAAYVLFILLSHSNTMVEPMIFVIKIDRDRWMDPNE